MKVADHNWYGFDHAKVNDMFKGDLTYLGTTCVGKEYHPVAVYHAANPDLSKGHKEFMLLQVEPDTRGGLVRGLDRENFEKYAIQDGLYCLVCDTFIYSVMRHDMRSCECEENEVAIDGGKDYSKVSHSEGSRFEHGKLNLITGEITLEKKSKKWNPNRKTKKEKR